MAIALTASAVVVSAGLTASLGNAGAGPGPRVSTSAAAGSSASAAASEASRRGPAPGVAALNAAREMTPLPGADASLTCPVNSRRADHATSLCVQISMLPDHVPADVTVTGPYFFRRHLAQTAALLDLVPGTYTIRAEPVRVSSMSYYPVAATATVQLSFGQHATEEVDYADILPDTTMVAAASTVSGLTGSPAGPATLTLTSLPAGLAAGDILALGVTGPTPYGFLGQVTSITQDGTAFAVSTVPATLYQAMPQGEIDPAWTEPAEEQVVSEPLLSCGASASLSVTGSLSLTYGGDFTVDWANHAVTAAAVDASATLTQQIQAVAQGQAGCTLNPLQVGPTVTFNPVTITVGYLPITIVPQLQFFLTAGATTSASLTMGETFQATATAGIHYTAGQPLTPVSSFTTAFTPQPPTPDLQATLSASIGPTLTLLVEGVAGPAVNFDGSLALNVTPLNSPVWMLTGDLEAGGGLVIPLLNFNESDPSLISYSRLLDSSPPVIATTSLPAGQVGDSYSQTLQATSGTPPYVWSIASGSLPPGLSLNSSTGAITGTPTEQGTSTFTVNVADSSDSLLNPTGLSATQAESITISPQGSPTGPSASPAPSP